MATRDSSWLDVLFWLTTLPSVRERERERARESEREGERERVLDTYTDGLDPYRVFNGFEITHLKKSMSR